MTHQTRPALIGGFVVGGIALVIGALLVLAGSKFSRHTAPFVVYFGSTVDGLSHGSPVKFRGLEVGYVRDIYLSLSKRPRDPRDLRIPVVIELDADRFKSRGVTVDLGDRVNLERLLNEGLRVRLSSSSLLTGQRTVELDIVPGTPMTRVNDPSVDLPEIPTLPGTFDGVQANAIAVLDRVARLDFDRMAGAIQRSLDGIDRTVNDPAILATLTDVRAAAGELRGTVVELHAMLGELRAAVPEVRATVVAARTAVTSGGAGVDALTQKLDHLVDRAAVVLDGAAPIGTLGRELAASAQRTLATIDAAVRAVHHLAEHLDQDPAAVLRGGNP